MMLAPAECRRRHVAAPTRLAPPVISTTLPCTRRSGYTRITGKPNTSMAHTPSHRERTNMPTPTHEALAHSARVVAHIERMIAASGGWISFADYMGAALYAPALGYYSAGSRKFGPSGDFVTAPEISPLFGACVARQCAAVLADVGQGAIMEIGAGTGRLAGDILERLESLGSLPARYLILETSADLRERQQRHLAARLPRLVDR